MRALMAMVMFGLAAAAGAQEVITTITLTVEVAIPDGPSGTRTTVATITEDALTTDTAAVAAGLAGPFEYIDGLPINGATKQAHKDGMLAQAVQKHNAAAVQEARDLVIELGSGNGPVIQIRRLLENILGRIIVEE